MVLRLGLGDGQYRQPRTVLRRRRLIAPYWRSSALDRCRLPSQGDATTGRPSLGWTMTKPGWKDSPEPRPMRESIVKVLLFCGCRLAAQQITCGATKVGRGERSSSIGGTSVGAAIVST